MSDAKAHPTQSLLRDKAPASGIGQSSTSRSIVRTAVYQKCEDCRVANAYHAWHDVNLTPAFNHLVSFADYGIPPAGSRAVIELVTAQIFVPEGEWARLRMYGDLGGRPSNIDLFLTFQGNVNGQALYVATHNIRAYSDGPIEFDINRDNADTGGNALICISGYVVQV